VKQLKKEPIGGGRCDSRTAGVAEGAFGGGRLSQRAGVVSAAVARSLQVPEVPAGGAKQRTGREQCTVRRAQTSNSSADRGDFRGQSVDKGSARTQARLRVLAMMQGRRRGITGITGRRDLPGRATTNRGRVRSPRAKAQI
jgi:hypothetical protein